MKIKEKYIETLKTFGQYITVSEWAERFTEQYPDELKKANRQAENQKRDTTGLREIAARISSNLSSGNFGKQVVIDESERPRKVKYLSPEEANEHVKQEEAEDIEPLTRKEIIEQAKDRLKILELYRLEEYRSIQKGFKDFFNLDFELDHAHALLDKNKHGSHHPNNIQLLLKYHNGKKSNQSWKRFSFEEQEEYIKDCIQLQSRVAKHLNIKIDDRVLNLLLERLHRVYF